MYASKLLKVLYSPRKTLREVIQDPKYIGPLIVLILLIAVSVGSTYIIIAKQYYEQTLPTGTNLDVWTQNSTFWTSNASNTIITESNDSITGTIYGNVSIEFSTQNSPLVLMNLTGIGTINCTAYNLLSFRIKLKSPSTPPPKNVTIQMFSDNSSSNYYYSDLTDTFLNTTYDVWNNVTLPLANVTGWFSTGQPTWDSITGLQLQFNWAQSSNVTLLIDGLFFHGPFESLLESGGSSYLLSGAIGAVFQFAMTWIVFTGLIYALARFSGGKPVWKPMFVAIGFVLITTFIGAVITGIAYASLPELRYPFEVIGGVPGEGTAALNTIASQTLLFYQVTLIAQIFIWLWTIALAAIVVRQVVEFSRVKSIMIAFVAYAIIIFLEFYGIIPPP